MAKSLLDSLLLVAGGSLILGLTFGLETTHLFSRNNDNVSEGTKAYVSELRNSVCPPYTVVGSILFGGGLGLASRRRKDPNNTPIYE